MPKQIETYRKEIAEFRELAAVMSGRLAGDWHEISIEEACRITGEKQGLPRRFF